MPQSSRRELTLEAIGNLQAASARAVKLKDSNDPEIKSLAEAVHFLSFGAQQIALALSDEGRADDFPWITGQR